MSLKKCDNMGIWIFFKWNDKCICNILVKLITINEIHSLHYDSILSLTINITIRRKSTHATLTIATEK